MRAFAIAALCAACNNTLDMPGGVSVDAGTMDDDPLAIPGDVEPGTLDDIHQTIIVKRCAGQPGLCHNGQFEPNLSTPAATYAYLVNRPSLEKPDQLRVDPGNPSGSVLIDKLRGRDVATLMPLGADPLDDAEIELIETWIRDGALREPGADPAPMLNNPPGPPEVGVFDGVTGERLDVAGGGARIAVGQPLILRHSVHDFETADPQIPFATFLVTTSDGLEVLLRPTSPDGTNLGVSAYEAAGPMGAGDLLNFRFDYAFPATVQLRNPQTEEITSAPAAGTTFNLIVLYIDVFEAGTGILGFSIQPNYLVVE